MGFRFRRSVRLLPGVRLNFSRSGVSTTVGGRGASVTVGKRGARANVSIPGTGMSYSTRLNDAQDESFSEHHQRPAATRGSQVVVALVLLAVFGACAALLSGG